MKARYVLLAGFLITFLALFPVAFNRGAGSDLFAALGLALASLVFPWAGLAVGVWAHNRGRSWAWGIVALLTPLGLLYAVLEVGMGRGEPIEATAEPE